MKSPQSRKGNWGSTQPGINYKPAPRYNYRERSPDEIMADLASQLEDIIVRWEYWKCQ